MEYYFIILSLTTILTFAGFRPAEMTSPSPRLAQVATTREGPMTPGLEEEVVAWSWDGLTSIGALCDSFSTLLQHLETIDIDGGLKIRLVEEDKRLSVRHYSLSSRPCRH